MNEIQRHIKEALERMEPGDRASFGPYTFAEVLDGFQSPSAVFGFRRIADEVAEAVHVDHDAGDSEPPSISAARVLRAEWEVDLAVLAERLGDA